MLCIEQHEQSIIMQLALLLWTKITAIMSKDHPSGRAASIPLGRQQASAWQ
jgi:hypothetical protein